MLKNIYKGIHFFSKDANLQPIGTFMGKNLRRYLCRILLILSFLIFFLHLETSFKLNI